MPDETSGIMLSALAFGVIAYLTALYLRHLSVTRYHDGRCYICEVCGTYQP